jgi:hypothetical protein
MLKLYSLDWRKPACTRLAKRCYIMAGEDGSAVRNIALHEAIMDELAKTHEAVSPRFARALSIE